jgi:hypothetical protein
MGLLPFAPDNALAKSKIVQNSADRAFTSYSEKVPDRTFLMFTLAKLILWLIGLA